jgi:hypothetical protein
MFLTSRMSIRPVIEIGWFLERGSSTTGVGDDRKVDVSLRCTSGPEWSERSDPAGSTIGWYAKCLMANFPEPVPFKDENGGPLEPGGSSRGYYQPGVRKIPEAVFLEIVSRAETSAAPPPSGGTGGGGGLYAPPAVLERLSDSRA